MQYRSMMIQNWRVMLGTALLTSAFWLALPARSTLAVNSTGGVDTARTISLPCEPLWVSDVHPQSRKPFANSAHGPISTGSAYNPVTETH